MTIDAGKKQDGLGACPKCGDPLEAAYGVVRCSRWGCDFIEGLREFASGKHLARVKEEADVKENLDDIIKEERKREKQLVIKGRFGFLARLGFRR